MERSRRDSLAAAIEDELRRWGNAERAAGAKRYLKSDLAFLGADTKSLRTVIRHVLADAGPLRRRDVLTLVNDLWARGIFELRAAAVEILIAHGALLNRADFATVERRLRASRTWALVDPLAIHVAGPLVARFPTLGGALDRWARDADFWVRRAAMLALLLPLRRGGGDFGRFARYAETMLEEREFFIRKAIGWVLRETAKQRPAMVSAWVASRTRRISGVTLREAVRYLPEAQRRRLIAAHREGRRETRDRTRRGD